MPTSSVAARSLALVGSGVLSLPTSARGPNVIAFNPWLSTGQPPAAGPAFASAFDPGQTPAYVYNPGASLRAAPRGPSGSGVPPVVTVTPTPSAAPPPAAAPPPPSHPMAAAMASPEPATPAARRRIAASIPFDGQSAGLSDVAESELDHIAKNIALRAFAAGADADSRKIALARALVVRSYLIDRGVKSRIEVGAFSDDGERVDILVPNL